MWRGVFKVALAAVLFGIVHSYLANPHAEAVASTLVGKRAVAGLYRPFYVLLSLALTAGLVLYIRLLPGRDLYRARGPAAWVLHAGQAAALAYAAWAVYHVGLNHLTGWESLEAWWRGTAIPALPDGQGPAPRGDGTMRATGPFALGRQQLNFAVLPLIWLWPRMTTKLLTFNLVMTVYLVLGSLHSEWHLVETYGQAYRFYQQRVPFFIPGLPRR
jgi:methanethiol S-methyltransferase